MTSIVQKILVDSDHHKLRMQEKDVAGIVKFGLIASTQSHYYLYHNGIPEFKRKWLMLTVK